MSSLDNLKKLLFMDNNPTDREEPEVMEVGNIYDIMRILDKYRNIDSLKRVYKTSFDYDRDRNSISLIFKIDNFRRTNNFDMVFNSEYIREMFNDLKDLNLPESFIKKLMNKSNYKLHLHGNIGIYQTPYFKIRGL